MNFTFRSPIKSSYEDERKKIPLASDKGREKPIILKYIQNFLFFFWNKQRLALKGNFYIRAQSDLEGEQLDNVSLPACLTGGEKNLLVPTLIFEGVVSCYTCSHNEKKAEQLFWRSEPRDSGSLKMEI